MLTVRKTLTPLWQAVTLGNLEPAVLEAHREHLLRWSKIALFIGPPIYFFTIFLFNFLYYPEKLFYGFLAIGPAVAACFFVLPTLKMKFIKKHYHLPLFLALAVFSGYAEIANFHVTGGTSGSFFFPYFLIFFGIAALYPGRLLWVFVTAATLVLEYTLYELFIGGGHLSRQTTQNIIFLVDASVIAIAANRVFYAIVIRDKRNHLKLESEKEKLLKVSAQVAHDIRSPLTSLNAVVQHWKEKLPEDDFFTLLDLSAKRLHSIANEVLDQHGPKKKTAFSLHRVLDELVGEYQSGSSPDLTFQKDYGEALSFVGNRDRIQRAFGNIIKNAVEAMNGRGRITIRTTQEESHAVVSISDTGPGITPEKLQRVLRGGFTEGKADGHGIGMVVVREAVEENGGILEAESRPGHGTMFRIKLPLPDSSALKGLAEPQEGEGVFELAVSSGEPVVVIDDDPSAQLQWELTLRRLNLQPLTYESYEQFSNSPRPPLSLRGGVKTAIVDYHFDNSELNGFQIVEKLKAEGYRNIILCTGEYWKPVIRQKAGEMGVPVCPKPIPKVVVK